ncbi:MAG: lysophospholipid acyltransferase family protein [Candidatus Eiseniibacteriota bacterium]|nr:MAG: lysophospholipid acyltransferase family protein [Candidatus Eisenbacteria bacterium]
MFSLLFFNILKLGVSAMPPRVGYFLARRLVAVHYYTYPGRRAAVVSNVRHILGNSPSPRFRELGEKRVAKLIFRSFNEFLYEFFKIPHLDRSRVKEVFTLEGLENLDEALARRKGAIIATAHIGNWEAAGIALALLGYRLHVVAGVQFSTSMSEHVKNIKRRLNMSVVSPEESFRALFRALRNNETVVLLVDGDVFVNGLPTEFFSKPAKIPSGAATLSLKTGAPIVPGYIKRLGPFRFKVHIDDPIFPEPTGNKAADIEKLTRKVLSRIESYIEENLDQWCIFRDVWAPVSRPRTAARAQRTVGHVHQNPPTNS